MKPRVRPTSAIPWIVVVPFAASGVLHLVRPGVFEGIIPGPLRDRRHELVLASGVVELACAAGLLYPRTRRAAGTVSAGLLLALWPANAQMSLDLLRRALERRDAASVLALIGSVARLPVQVPLIRAAWRAR